MAHSGLEQSPIPLASNRLRILQIGRDLPHLRMSAGICQYRRGRDIDALLRCADRALYEAKSRGRDALSPLMVIISHRASTLRVDPQRTRHLFIKPIK
jgi:hypothetical protein